MNVLLAHGFGRTPLAMWWLARHLRRAGHAVEQFGYVATIEPYERIVRRLDARLARLAAAEDEYALIGHSLGGLLLRVATTRLRPDQRKPAHLIMLGTPNRPPQAIGLLRTRPLRWVAGGCGRCMASAEWYDGLPALTVPYTVIAGTRGPTGRLSPFGRDPNDGLITVHETCVRDGDEVLTFPVFHTYMMDDARVRAAIMGLLTPDGSKT
jgi:pimeloyl-ACP methyl ester carboxylesterase